MAELSKPKKLQRRIISAAILIPLALGVFYLGGWLFVAVVLLFAAVMLHEWLTITQYRASYRVFALILLALTAAAVLLELQQVTRAFAAAGLALVVAAAAAHVLHKSVFWTVLGTAYVAAPVMATIWLREGVADGLALTLWVLLIVWATDIGAYFAGTTLGGPKLMPRVSPNKTWSGLAGGMTAAALVAAGAGKALGMSLGLVALAIAGALLAAWAQAGDLAESALKRRFSVKDSGAIIPGHGGVLDRIDGYVFVVPAVAIAVALS